MSIALKSLSLLKLSIDCDTVISLLKLYQLTVTQFVSPEVISLETQLYHSWSYLNWLDTVISLLKLSQLTLRELNLTWIISILWYSYISHEVINWLWHSYISPEVMSIDCNTVISFLKLSQLTVTQLYLSWSYLNCCDTIISLLKLYNCFETILSLLK